MKMSANPTGCLGLGKLWLILQLRFFEVEK